jgi:hypothetical protein
MKEERTGQGKDRWYCGHECHCLCLQFIEGKVVSAGLKGEKVQLWNGQKKERREGGV